MYVAWFTSFILVSCQTQYVCSILTVQCEDDVHAIPYACAVLLIGGLVHFYRFTDSWSLTSSLRSRVGHRVTTLVDSTRESILALRCTSGGSKVRRAGRGMPVLICILAPSLCFHAITFERSIFSKNTIF